MKNLFYKLISIVIITAIGFQLIFGMVYPKLIAKSGDSYINRWIKFYSQKSNAEIICIGSSRVHRHCNAEIISEVTHQKTEVIAAPGAKIDFFEKLYKDYLVRNPRPKVLLVGIDLTGLDSTVYTPYPEYFFPAINSSDSLSNMNEYKYIIKYKPAGYFYYKELYTDIIENPENQQHINGFLVRDIKWDSNLEGIIKKYPNGFDFSIDRSALSRLIRFMVNEKKAGVECVGFIAPEYSQVWEYEKNRNESISEILKEADSAGVSIWNFSDSSYKPCFNKRYFYNSQHLNKEGSSLFSKDLADSVLKYTSERVAHN